MSYSIGSIAELISGVNVPNKKEIVQKEFKPQTSVKREKPSITFAKNRQFSEDVKIEPQTFGKMWPDKKDNKKTIKQKKGMGKKSLRKQLVNDELYGKYLDTNEKEEQVNISNTSLQEDEDFNSLEKTSKIKKLKHGYSKANSDAEHELVSEIGNENNLGVSDKKKKKKRKHPITECSEEVISKKRKSKVEEEPDIVTEEVGENTYSGVSVTPKVIDTINKKGRKKSKATFNENAKRRVDEKTKEETRTPLDPERESRTIFVGNVPRTLKKIKLTRLFKKYGNVEAVRIRSIAFANPKVPKKVAICKSEFHPDRTSVNAFVRFKKRESAVKALEVNGFLLNEHHLRVKLVKEDTDSKSDPKNSIFLGNVPFGAEDEDIWKLFVACGGIESVRIIRDSKTNIGKGFGYVNFKSRDAVELALQMVDVKLDKRTLRISRTNVSKKRDAKGKKIRHRVRTTKIPDQNQDNTEDSDVQSKEKTSVIPSAYQGSKVVEKKKKKKLNKSELKKKKIISKLLPKSKLP